MKYGVNNTLKIAFYLSYIMKRLALLFALSITLNLSCLAQGGKALAEAERFFGIKSYEEALPKFVEAINAGEKSPLVHYKTGVCYQKTIEITEQSKAIPYFEYALKNKAAVPNTLWFELGDLY